MTRTSVRAKVSGRLAAWATDDMLGFTIVLWTVLLATGDGR